MKVQNSKDNDSKREKIAREKEWDFCLNSWCPLLRTPTSYL